MLFFLQSSICPKDVAYDSDVTTKQNILCDGRSIQQVIQASLDGQLELQQQQQRPKEDVDQNTNKNFLPSKDDDEEEEGRKQAFEFQAPDLNFVLPRQKLFVLILDRSPSSSEPSASSWETLQQALLGFINLLPVGAHLSIITYGPEPELNLSPTPITTINKEGLHGRIPRRPLASAASRGPSKSCLDCALSLAFKLMNVTEKNGSINRQFESHILAVTQSSVTAVISEATERKILENSVPLNVISLSSDGQDKLGFSTRFGNKFVLASRNSEPHFLYDLAQILTTVIGSSDDRKITSFHRSQRIPDEEDNTISGNFVVEERLSRNVWIVLTVEDERDIESFEVLSPTGRKHSFPKFENRLAFFNLKGNNEPGIWSYNVKLYQTLDDVDYPVFLDVSGEPENEESIILNTWVSQINGDVIMYASVMQGSLPVLDAEVVATVSRPGQPSVKVTLRDTGLGYPDITKGDGIYSSYFTDYAPESGYYQVTVTATHNMGSAKTPKLSANIDADSNLCCGSEFPVSYTIPTGPFNRYSVLPAFYVDSPTSFYIRQHQRQEEVQRRLVNDVFPPSRVTDFKVDNYVEDSLFVTLRWTAPGGDYDKGKAFRYEIRCYTNKEALRDDNFSEMSIPVHPSLVPEPEMNGQEQQCTVGVPWPNEVFYYAIVAFDEAGNRGKISNNIAVFIKETPSTLPPLHDVRKNNNQVDIGPRQPLPLLDNPYQITYIAIGVAGGVVVILLIVALLIVRRHCLLSKSTSSKNSFPRSKSALDVEKIDDDSSFSGTLKKFMLPNSELSSSHTVVTEQKPVHNSSMWTNNNNNNGSSPTSDYSSQKSTLPSISEAVSWQFKQRATSQEIPGIHKVMTEKHFLAKLEEGHENDEDLSKSRSLDIESRAATHSTDCSLYECSDSNSSGHEPSPSGGGPESPGFRTAGLKPRISVLEDFSVYRDLSNLSYKEYYSLGSQLPAELQGGHVITVPPYYDMNTLDSAKKRHESLV